MRTTICVLALSAALLGLGACGGGGTGVTDATVEPLNASEQALAGTYSLATFKLYAVGEQVYWPSDFETWEGELVLGADRIATVDIELCEHGDTPTRTCARQYEWRADAGLLELTCLDGSQPNGVAEWDAAGGMGSIVTRFFVPTNRPDCTPLLVDEGYSLLTWERAQ